MKNLKKMSVKFYLMLALSAVAVLAGCKDDEEVVTPQFPELKEQTVTLTETTDENGNNVFSASLDITFSANLDWTLKSDAAWCRFVNGEFKETTASGKAGDQTLKVEIISDESWNYTSADVAQITLSMASQEQVIYKITRGAKQYQDLVVRNEAGEILGLDNPLTIKGSGLREIPGDSVYTIITATADMEVGIIDNPSWLSLHNEGNGVFKLIFDNDNEDNISPINSFGTDKGYKLVVATEDYNNSGSDKIRKVEIPLSYEGLKSDYVELYPFYELPLIISKDGMIITLDNENNDEVGNYYDNPLKFDVKNVRNNEYRVLIFDKTDEELPTGGTRPVYDFTKEVDWFTCTKTETGFTVDQPGNLMNSELKERGVIVMVFSEDFCKEHENDWASALLDPDGYILPEYTKNTYAVFTQKDLSMSLSGFFEYNGEMIAFGTEYVIDDDDYSDDAKIKRAITDAMCEDQWGEYLIAFDKLLLDNGDIYLEIVNYKSGSQTQFPEIPGVTVEMVSKDEKQYVKISGSLEEEMTEMQYLMIMSPDGTDYVNAGIVINDSEKSETEPEV